MNNFILIIIIAITTWLHWHYYRWCIFNTRINWPQIYRSHKGVIIIFKDKNKKLSGSFLDKIFYYIA